MRSLSNFTSLSLSLLLPHPHLRRSVQQRAIRHVRVARDPPAVGRAPVDVLSGLVVEDVLERRRRADLSRGRFVFFYDFGVFFVKRRLSLR